MGQLNSQGLRYLKKSGVNWFWPCFLFTKLFAPVFWLVERFWRFIRHHVSRTLAAFGLFTSVFLCGFVFWQALNAFGRFSNLLMSISGVAVKNLFGLVFGLIFVRVFGYAS